MIVTIPYKIRKDGVKLVLTLDAVVNETGEIVRDESGNPIPRGFYILQNETGIEYEEAVDIENTPYTYSETNKHIKYTEDIVV